MLHRFLACLLSASLTVPSLSSGAMERPKPAVPAVLTEQALAASIVTQRFSRYSAPVRLFRALVFSGVMLLPGQTAPYKELSQPALWESNEAWKKAQKAQPSAQFSVRTQSIYVLQAALAGVAAGFMAYLFYADGLLGEVAFARPFSVMSAFTALGVVMQTVMAASDLMRWKNRLEAHTARGLAGTTVWVDKKAKRRIPAKEVVLWAEGQSGGLGRADFVSLARVAFEELYHQRGHGEFIAKSRAFWSALGWSLSRVWEPLADVRLQVSALLSSTIGPTTEAELEQFFTSTGHSILQNAGVPAPPNIRQAPVFRDVPIAVLERPGETATYAGNYLCALREQGNSIKVISIRDPEARWKLIAAQPRIVILPENDESSRGLLQSVLDDPSGAFDGRMDVLTYPTQRMIDEEGPDPDVSLKVNLSIGGDERFFQAALRALGHHASQLARTRYDEMMKHYFRADAARARHMGIAPHPQPYANNFVMTEIDKNGNVVWNNQLRYQLLAEGEVPTSGFVGLPIAALARAIAISPHPDDAEIAMVFALLRFMSEGNGAVSVIHGSGHAGLFNDGFIHDAIRLFLRRGWKDPRYQWQKALRDVKADARKPEAEEAAAELERFVGQMGKLQVLYKKLDIVWNDEGESRAKQEAYTFYKKILTDKKQAPGSPFLFFLPHPKDSHPSHRRATQVMYRVMVRLKADPAFQNIPFLAAHYLAPWAGTANLYFHSPSNVATETVKGQKMVQAAMAAEFKQGLAYLTGELAGRFGGQSPSPEEMGGGYAERFTRARMYSKKKLQEIAAMEQARESSPIPKDPLTEFFIDRIRLPLREWPAVMAAVLRWAQPLRSPLFITPFIGKLAHSA